MNYVFGNVDKNLAKEKCKKTTQYIVWSGLMEFKEENTIDYENDEKKVKKVEELFNSTINTLFTSQGLDSNNVEYFCALHTNTDIPHVHFLYWENKPLLKTNDNITYSTSIVPKKAVIDFSKAIYDYSKLNNNQVYINIQRAKLF